MTKKKAQPEKPKVGCPTKYREAIADEICTRLATGETIRSMCRKSKHLPCRDTIHKWILRHKYFADRYALARKLNVQCMQDEILDIADDPAIAENMVMINWARIQIDTRKFLLSKVAPKVDLSGSYIKQLQQIKEAVERFDINTDMAGFLMKMIELKALLSPTDEFKDKLEQLRNFVAKGKEE
jgi:hypothetical protein